MNTPTPIDCTSEAHFRAATAELLLASRGKLLVLETQHDVGCPAIGSGIGCACQPDLLVTDITTGVPTVLARWLPPTVAGTGA
jgi:hypothetical protein